MPERGGKGPDFQRANFYIRSRIDGRLIRYSLGQYPTVALEDARIAAREQLNQIAASNLAASAEIDALPRQGTGAPIIATNGKTPFNGEKSRRRLAPFYPLGACTRTPQGQPYLPQAPVVPSNPSFTF